MLFVEFTLMMGLLGLVAAFGGFYLRLMAGLEAEKQEPEPPVAEIEREISDES
jgi:hypothetical protein